MINMDRDNTTTTSDTTDTARRAALSEAPAGDSSTIEMEQRDLLKSSPEEESQHEEIQHHHRHRHSQLTQRHDHIPSQSEIMSAARATLKRNHREAQRALNQRQNNEEGGDEEEESSGSSNSNNTIPHTAASSRMDRESSSSVDNNSASLPGERNNHVVTTTTTTNTTSSGDDRDSGNNSGDTPSASSSSGPSSSLTRRHHHRHNESDSHHSSSGSSPYQHQQQFLNRQFLQQHNAQHDQQQQARSSANPALHASGDNNNNLSRVSQRAQLATEVASSRNLHTSESGATSSASEGEHIQQQALEPVKLKSSAHSSLIQPHREPGYHTIKRTFHQLSNKKKPPTHSQSSASTTSNDEDQQQIQKKPMRKSPKKAPKLSDSSDLKPAAKKRQPGFVTKKNKPLREPNGPASAASRGGNSSHSPEDDSDHSNKDQEGGGGGSSSGSGTEGGYAGSGEYSGPQSSSPSEDSSEGSQHGTKAKRRPRDQEDDKGNNSSSESSEIADFSSGTASPSIESSYNSDEVENEDELEQSYLRAKRSALIEQESMLQAVTKKRRLPPTSNSNEMMSQMPLSWMPSQEVLKMPARRLRAEMSDKTTLLDGKPPITCLGSDVMAHVLTFLEPPEILDVLTSPLSKDWNKNFTSQPELWRVLCLVEPFKASVKESEEANDANESDSEDSFCSFGDTASLQEQGKSEKRALARYRLLYTSFVRCMRYLAQIKDDAINGRPPSFIDYGMAGGGIARTQHSSPKQAPSVVGASKSLQSFLSRARVAMLNQNGMDSSSSGSISSSDMEAKTGDTGLIGTVDSSGEAKRKRKHSSGDEKKLSKKLKFGNSMVTQRLFGPTADGQVGNMTLPWSCAIYSIVNWMVAFSDVEGIQTLCLKVLPFLLEDEQQRMTAQRAGLTDVVLRAMVMFPNSMQLHTASFHTIVLLARPLGGREGMLFHSSMINASGIFGSDDSRNGKSGIAVMLDSIGRFEHNDELQAMACWSLVNIALAPAQKAALVKLGGIQATANAMTRHPYSAEVQFRALFALINLVIPSVRLNNNEANERMDEQEIQEQLGEVNDTSEKEILDEVVGNIAELVVNAMKNFCSSEAILNRACLVLHNLSLTHDYHTTLLFTPNCYQMLEWCLANYRTDQVLQQSATGTLHRLQITLSNDGELSRRFTESLRAQQQLSLEQAHREAIHLSEQQAALLRNQYQGRLMDESE